METGPVGAVVLAAGRSRRMGEPKLVLPWGDHTVIEQVVRSLQAAGISEIVVVTGGARGAVEAALAGYPVKLAHNPDYEQSEMLASLQTGIRVLSPALDAFLVVLGDQPGIEAATVKAVLEVYRGGGARLVVPSYKMRRGHPWLAARALWPELLAMSPEQNMRDFLQAHAGEIVYVPVDSEGVLKDLDTPEDYQAQKPGEKG